MGKGKEKEKRWKDFLKGFSGGGHKRYVVI